MSQDSNIDRQPLEMASWQDSFKTLWGQLKHWQQIGVMLFIAIKLMLIVWLPLTGDEAYFILWGQHLSLGYYDHPPLVGWVLGLMSQLADDLTWYRSFAFVSAVVIAASLFHLWRLYGDQSEQNSQQAAWLALVFFVSPISLMFVVTANDTVLVLFAVLGVLFFARNLKTQLWRDATLAGMFLGLAFLAKYFAAFMLFGLLLFSLWQWRKFRLSQLLLMVGLVLIAVLENLYFNATHCWNNILFNFFSRTEESQFDLTHLLNFSLMVVVLLSPLGLFYAWRHYFKPIESETLNNRPVESTLLLKLIMFASLPLVMVLFVVSLKNEVGLHWPLIAVTLLHLLYAPLANDRARKLMSLNLLLSVIIGAALLVALNSIDRLVKPSQKHQVALYTESAQLCQALPINESNQSFFTLDYSSQSALSYHCGNDQIHVFGSVSKYGREDDKRVNFKRLDKQDLSVLLTHKKDLKKLQPYFAELMVKEIILQQADMSPTVYYWVTGLKFDYSLYRQQVLTLVNDKFYTAPEWLDALNPFESSCNFQRKYGFTE